MKTCGVVLGGGGAKGSFQVGALRAILENDYKITHVTGTSVGALNGALVAINKFDILNELWHSINEKNSFTPSYPLGIAQGILSMGSLYSNKWLVKNIDENISVDELYSIDSAFYGCVITNLVDGKKRFPNNKKSEWKPHILKSILASGSLPPAFPPVFIGGLNAVDGGLTSPLPVKELLNFPMTPDKIFIIPAGTTELEAEYTEGFSKNILRSIDVLFDSVMSSCLKSGEKYWTEDERFVMIQPEENLIGVLESNPTKIRAFIQLGYDIAQDVISEIE
jgi:predicted acylesterase/phospholipase RssA